MKYYYSESTGMVTVQGELKGAETEDIALINYYKREIEKINFNIQKSKEQIHKQEQRKSELENKFKTLLLNYPEELV